MEKIGHHTGLVSLQSASKVSQVNIVRPLFGGNTHDVSEAAIQKEIQQIIQLEGRQVKKEYLRARALFNITQDNTHLMPWLPFLKAYENNLSEKSQYENLVKTILNKCNFYVSSKPNSARGIKKNITAFVKTLEHLDPSAKFLIAGSIVEGLQKRPDLIEAVTKRPDKLMFIAYPNLSLFTGGSSGDVPIITLNTRDLWSTRKTNNIPLHEFIHQLCLDSGKILDIPPAMTKQEKETFTQIRKKLFDEHRCVGKPWYKKLFYKTLNWIRLRFNLFQDKGVGIKAYAFSNDKEFLTTTAEDFLKRPHVFNNTEPGKALYKFYTNFFKIDPKVQLKSLLKKVA